MNFKGVDQFGNPAYAILRLSDSRTTINNGAFSQAGSLIMANGSVRCCKLYVSLASFPCTLPWRKVVMGKRVMYKKLAFYRSIIAG